MAVNEPQPPLERATFTEEVLPTEPASDVKLVLQDIIKSDGTIVTGGALGVILRERMVKIDNPEKTGYSLVLTSVLLDANDVVISDPSPPHEIVFTGEALGRLGSSAAIEAAIDKAREEAAAAARLHFIGLELAEQVIASRLP